MSTPALVRSNDIPTTNLPQSETLGPEDIKLNSSSIVTLKVNFPNESPIRFYMFRTMFFHLQRPEIPRRTSTSKVSSKPEFSQTKSLDLESKGKPKLALISSLYISLSLLYYLFLLYCISLSLSNQKHEHGFMSTMNFCFTLPRKKKLFVILLYNMFYSVWLYFDFGFSFFSH
jgi:hypothetical protein